MKQLLKELEERLKYLESQPETDEIKWRKAEVVLSIVRVQQLILPTLRLPYDGCKHTNSKPIKPEDGYNWHCPDCGFSMA